MWILIILIFLVGSCLTRLYIIAFTSGQALAESLISVGKHNVELQSGGVVRTLKLYDRSGIDFSLNKGDLWEFGLTSYGCITISSIQRVSVVGVGIDNWNIASIVTLVKDSSNQVQVLTRDFNVNHWVKDGERFDLTFAGIEIPVLINTSELFMHVVAI